MLLLFQNDGADGEVVMMERRVRENVGEIDVAEGKRVVVDDDGDDDDDNDDDDVVVDAFVESGWDIRR